MIFSNCHFCCAAIFNNWQQSQYCVIILYVIYILEFSEHENHVGDKLDLSAELLCRNKMIITLKHKLIFIRCKSTRKHSRSSRQNSLWARSCKSVSAILKINWPHTSCHV